MRASAVVAEASAKESDPPVFQLPFFLTVDPLPKLVLFTIFVFEVRFIWDDSSGCAVVFPGRTT